MELQLKDFSIPGKISFNYEELKAELMTKVQMYETLVYTDEQVKDSKSDKAKLNKLKKALNDERIRLEKEYMVPFQDFKAKVNEIIGIIDKPIMMIDQQINEYESKQKQEKRNAIEELFAKIGFQSFVSLDMIFNTKWLNATVSMKSIEDDMNAELYRIGHDIATLKDLPEFAFEATDVYKTTLDINAAIAEGKRMQDIAKQKAEQERIAAETKQAKAEEFVLPKQTEEEKKFEEGAFAHRAWINFSAHLTAEDAAALKEFFKSRNITFKAI